MELREYLAITRKWWWLLLLGAVLGLGAGYAANSLKTVVYQARTTLVIGSNSAQRFSPDETQLATSERLGQIYAEMVRREPILKTAGENLELGLPWTDLRGQVRGQPVLGTQFFELYVTDTDPVRARLLADEIARQLIQQSALASEPGPHERFVNDQLAKIQARISEAELQLQELNSLLDAETTPEGVRRRQEEIESLQARIDLWQNNYASLLTFIGDNDTGSALSIIEPATLPTLPINANPIRDLALAGAVGLMLAFGLAFLVEYLDDTVKTSGDVEAVLGWPTLATIIDHPRSLKDPRDRLVVARNPFAPIAEAYRSLRTGLEFSEPASPTGLLVTSLVPGEGKTLTAANLAVAMAQGGRRVILVDADLRHPMVDKIFNLPNSVGLTGLLVGRNVDLEKALFPIEDKFLQIALAGSGLEILPSGPVPPNPAELLGSPQMAQLISRLKERAEVVIFDSPPLLAVTDAALLARRAGATLVVLEAGRHRAQACLRIKDMLTQTGIEPLGVVLNRLSSRQTGGYYYYQNYYYPSTNGHKPPQRRSIFKRIAGR